jgi:hypothetical protein
MKTKRERATSAMLEELELRAVLLRVTARKFERDVSILTSLHQQLRDRQVGPYIRRALRTRIQGLSDTQIAEQQLLESQDYYLLRSKGKRR